MDIARPAARLALRPYLVWLATSAAAALAAASHVLVPPEEPAWQDPDAPPAAARARTHAVNERRSEAAHERR